MKNTINTVLFDLDGTLCDTAPDLLLAMNHALSLYQQPSLTLERVHDIASEGAKGLIDAGFGQVGDEQFEEIKATLLNHYAESSHEASRLYPGMEQVLDFIEAAGLKWGIVTNKPTALTLPLLDQLHLSERSQVTVCGDTRAVAKPDPEPVHYACQQLGMRPTTTCFVGDHIRDIAAGNAAGTTTITALYGYIPQNLDAKKWPSHAYIEQPTDLIDWLKLNMSA
jgi:2-phosphoglycolate phosphatase